MNREEMIKDLESFCENQEYCFSDCIESICPLYQYEWDCDFHYLPDSELTKAYNDIFGRKITIPSEATNGEVITNILNPDGEECVSIEADGETIKLIIKQDWWNAPYKAESEEQECDMIH